MAFLKLVLFFRRLDLVRDFSGWSRLQGVGIGVVKGLWCSALNAWGWRRGALTELSVVGWIWTEQAAKARSKAC